MCDFCEGVLGDCVREECTDVAMVTIASAQQEWQLQEKARILEEVRRVVAMEIEIEVVNEQTSQVGTQVMRYCTISFYYVCISQSFPHIFPARVTGTLFPW